MAIILFVFTVVTAVSAAPSFGDAAYRDWQQDYTNNLNLHYLQDLYRTKRSGYGNVYVSPCAAAASSHYPVTAYGSSISGLAPYSYSHASYQSVPAHNGPMSPYHHHHHRHPYYRSEEELEDDQEIMGFTDMNDVPFDHMATARYSYGGAPTAHVVGGGAGGSQAVVSGPTVGVFPNANVGGCSVPLLVSCSPSIAHGQIVKAQPYNDGGPVSYQSNPYRTVSDQLHHKDAGPHPEKVQLLSEHDPKSTDDNHQ